MGSRTPNLKRGIPPGYVIGRPNVGDKRKLGSAQLVPLAGVQMGSTGASFAPGSNGTAVPVSSGGTVTSISMTVPAEFAVAGSPVTTTGTLAVTWATQADNKILANITGGSSVPSFSTVTAVLDHVLGSTNDKFAIRRSGTWTQDQISALLTAGTAISFSGTTNLVISGAYVAGTNITISGATISSTGASGSPGGSSDFIAPIYGGGPPSIMRSFGEQSVDGGAGTGPVGSGPVGAITIQWLTPKQKANFIIWDGARFANSNLISDNASYPNPAKYSTVGGPGETLLELCGVDGLPTRFVMNCFDNTGINTSFCTLNVRHARGTALAPTATQSGDIMGTLMGAAGYAVTDFSANVVRFRAVALENFDATHNGAKWNIQATAAGAIAAIDCANIAAAGCWFLGTNTNDNAAAGVVGEFVSSEVANTTVSLSTGTTANMTSISLTAGDWEVWGNIGLAVQPTTAITVFKGGTNTTSATLIGFPDASLFNLPMTNETLNNNVVYPVGRKRYSLSATTTVYLCANVTFGTSTLTAGGGLYARRIR